MEKVNQWKAAAAAFAAALTALWGWFGWAVVALVALMMIDYLRVKSFCIRAKKDSSNCGNMVTYS